MVSVITALSVVLRILALSIVPSFRERRYSICGLSRTMLDIDSTMSTEISPKHNPERLIEGCGNLNIHLPEIAAIYQSFWIIASLSIVPVIIAVLGVISTHLTNTNSITCIFVHIKLV